VKKNGLCGLTKLRACLVLGMTILSEKGIVILGIEKCGME
jgi:hypothetical protein